MPSFISNAPNAKLTGKVAGVQCCVIMHEVHTHKRNRGYFVRVELFVK